MKRSEIVEKEAVKTDRGYDCATRPQVSEYRPKTPDKMVLSGSKKALPIRFWRVRGTIVILSKRFYPTRLETRTKESNTYASVRV